jgi:hypothetical protein
MLAKQPAGCTEGRATIADLPDYPGAVRTTLETGEVKAGFGHTVEVRQGTGDPC